MISVLILTLNEENNLPRCLKAVEWSDDIVVLDSFSTDRTVEIAKAAGARVIQRKFDNWGAHMTWAVENIPFKHPWVYYTDADEAVTQELKEELQRVAGDSSRPEVAYRVRFKNQFMGRWLRWSSLYPTWIIRFFKPPCIRWTRVVHPTNPDLKGPEGRLKEHFLHYPFSRGIKEWLERHNNYSTHEANEVVHSPESRLFSLGHLFSLNAMKRRKALKALSYHLPFRPTLRFLYMYFWRLGFLDGWPGLTYCRLISFYEYMIDVKVKELRRREKGLPV